MKADRPERPVRWPFTWIRRRGFGFRVPVILALICLCLPAAAHPLDEANIYHFFDVSLAPGSIRIEYKLLVGGLSMFRVWDAMDTDHNHVLSDAEQRVVVDKVQRAVSATLDGRPLSISLERYDIPNYDDFISGVAPYLRFIFVSSPNGPPGGEHRLAIATKAFSDLSAVFVPANVTAPAGWQAASSPEAGQKGATVRFTPSGAAAPPQAPRAAAPPARIAAPIAAAGAKPVVTMPLAAWTEMVVASAVRASQAPAKAIPSQAAILPPSSTAGGALRGPAAAPAAPADAAHAASAAAIVSGGAAPAPPPRSRVLRVLRPFLMGRGGILIALWLAAVLGAAHALLPGHSKAVVGAYLVGSNGTVGDAVSLGAIVTAAHTGVVLLFGLLMWNLERFAPERVQPWLQVSSGALITALGVWMVGSGLTKLRVGARPGAAGSERFAYVPRKGAKTGRRSKKSLVSLGLAGGMVPCGDALVLLLFAHAQGRTAFGLVLVTAFGAGMALVLIAIGIAFVKASGLAARLRARSTDRLFRLAPVVSAVLITGMGLWITVDALVANRLVILNF